MSWSLFWFQRWSPLTNNNCQWKFVFCFWLINVIKASPHDADNWWFVVHLWACAASCASKSSGAGSGSDGIGSFWPYIFRGQLSFLCFGGAIISNMSRLLFGFRFPWSAILLELPSGSEWAVCSTGTNRKWALVQRCYWILWMPGCKRSQFWNCFWRSKIAILVWSHYLIQYIKALVWCRKRSLSWIDRWLRVTLLQSTATRPPGKSWYRGDCEALWDYKVAKGRGRVLALDLGSFVQTTFSGTGFMLSFYSFCLILSMLF